MTKTSIELFKVEIKVFFFLLFVRKFDGLEEINFLISDRYLQLHQPRQI